MHLLVDNSNTRTKFALADDTRLLDFRAIIDTADLTPASILAALGGIDFDSCLISSVVPDKGQLLHDTIGAARCTQLSHQTDIGINIDYPHPEQIGADRLANSVGVVHHYGAPAIVIDFGTAVTFDVVSADSAYLGGVIAPGLATMTDGLFRRTALLPGIRLEEPPGAIGKSTVHAMQSGAVYGYRGLVTGILERLQSELPQPAQLIATGGDGKIIVDGMKGNIIYHHELTLEGLRLIATRGVS